MEALKLWDFLDNRGQNIILLWVEEDRLTTRDRAMLNQKLDQLIQVDFSRAIKMKFLAGPLKNKRKQTLPIYKLHTKGDVQLRPMLCRGPISAHVEYTLLHGAVEIGGKLLPKNAPELAEDHRQTVLNDPSRRCPHERIT